MAGMKRTADEMEAKTDTAPIASIFEGFKAEIDQHHDRRERVIKASRDVTAWSKKIIFALQRAKNLSIGKAISDKRALEDIARLKHDIRVTLEKVVPDLVSIDAYRYQRQISGGVQEWMEAVLFEHYLEHQSMMTHEQAAKTLPEGVMLTYEDYALGLLDMTGELMKIAITSMATTGKLPGRDGGSSVLTDMQIMRTQFELMDADGTSMKKDFYSKLQVTRQSVEKVEASVYGMTVRGKERPPGWKPDLEFTRPAAGDED